MTTPTNGAVATRWTDAGKPRLIPSAAPIRALYTSVCEDVETQCTNVHLELRRLERGSNGALYTAAIRGTLLWFDTVTGTVGPVSADDEPEAAWLRAQLDDGLVPWLRHRWSRQREQLDEAAWRRYDWRKFRFGELVSYTAVLPATWDTVFGHEGTFYKVEDFHCIKPGSRARTSVSSSASSAIPTPSMSAA